MRCKRSRAGLKRGPANFRYWAGSQGIAVCASFGCSGGVESRDAVPGAPAVRLDTGPLDEIAEPPAEQAAPRQRRPGPRVEGRPRHERATPAIGPDLDAQRLPDARAAR